MNLIQPIKIALVVIIILVFTFEPIAPIENNIVVEEIKVAKIVDPKQLNCLAKNIFYEAGGESLSGNAQLRKCTSNHST